MFNLSVHFNLRLLYAKRMNLITNIGFVDLTPFSYKAAIFDLHPPGEEVE